MRLGTDQFDSEEPEVDVLPELTDAMRAELDEPLGRPLQAFTLDELFAEIGMRFGRYVFAAEERMGDDRDHLRWRTKGGFTDCVGLAHRFLRHMEREEFGE